LEKTDPNKRPPDLSFAAELSEQEITNRVNQILEERPGVTSFVKVRLCRLLMSQSLECLDLRSARIDGETSQVLAYALQANTTKHVMLSKACTDGDGFSDIEARGDLFSAALLEAFNPKHAKGIISKLQKLDLDVSSLSSSGASVLSSLLPNLPDLQHLNLANNENDGVGHNCYGNP